MSEQETAANRRRTNVIPDPQNKWLVDAELQCCGFVIEDVRTDSKTDSTDTASGNGPTHGVCPDCGNWMVPFEYQNVRRLHQWCDDCEVWYLADEGHECEPEMVADGGIEDEDADFMDALGATVQPAPEDHEKDVLVQVVGDEIAMRFALTEEQAEAMQDQLSDATADFEVSA